MSPNKPVDELDAAIDPPVDSAVDLSPPATVHTLGLTLADIPAVADDAIAAPPASKPLPPPLPRRLSRWTWRSPFALLLATMGAAAVALATRPAAVPQLPMVSDQVVAEGQTLRLDLSPLNRDALPPLEYELLGDVPSRARVTGAGELIWSTSEWDGPSQQTIRVRVAVAGEVERASELDLKVTVTEMGQSPRFSPLPNIKHLRLEDGLYHLRVQALDRDLPAGELTYGFAAEPTPAGQAWIDPRTGLFAWQPAPQDYGKTFRFVFRAGKPSTPAAKATIEVAIPEYGAAIEIGEGFSYRRFLTLAPGNASDLKLVASRAHYGGDLWLHRYNDSLLMIIEYPTAHAARQALPEYLAREDLLVPEFIAHEGITRLYHKHRLIFLTIGDDPSLIEWIAKVVGAPKKMVKASNRSAETVGGD